MDQELHACQHTPAAAPPFPTGPYCPTHKPTQLQQQSTKGCGKTVAGVPKWSGHTCTTEYFADPTTKQRTEEDVGAQVAHRHPTLVQKKKKKKSKKKNTPPDFYFCQAGKASETEVGSSQDNTYSMIIKLTFKIYRSIVFGRIRKLLMGSRKDEPTRTTLEFDFTF